MKNILISVIIVILLLAGCTTQSKSKEIENPSIRAMDNDTDLIETLSTRVIYDISGNDSRFTKTSFSWSFNGDAANLPVSAEYHTLTPNKTLLSDVKVVGDTVEFTPVKDQGTGIASVTLHVGEYKKTVFIKVYDLSLKLAAIQLDDGPSEFTEQILDTLNSAGVSATFFVTGKVYHDIRNVFVGAEVYPEILKEEAAWGHQIGNHTYEHPWQAEQDGVLPDGQTKVWADYTEEEVISQIKRLDDLIYDLAGFVPAYYNAPYGNEDVYANSSGKMLPSWGDEEANADTQDWRVEITKEQMLETILSFPPNAIIGMHDVYQKSADAIKEALDSPQAKEIQFVTFDEMDEILQRSRKSQG